MAQKEVQNLARLIEHNGFLKKNNVPMTNNIINNMKKEYSYADLDEMFSFLTEIQENKAHNLNGGIGLQFDKLIQKTESEMNDLNKQIQDKLSTTSTSSLPAPSTSPTLSDHNESPIASPVSAQTRKMDINGQSPIYSLQAQRSYSFEFQDDESSSIDISNGKEQINSSQQLTNININHSDEIIEKHKKQRVDKMINQLQEESAKQQQNNIMNKTYNGNAAEDLKYFDLLEFAERFFNNHPRDFGGGVIRTLTRRKKTNEDILTKSEMITWTCSNMIPISHLHMHDPENSLLACTIFKELNKYLQNDLKADAEIKIIQTIIAYGIEREELRDEIFIQLIRQSNNNPSRNECIKAWVLLGLTTAAFPASKIFSKYFYSYLSKHLRKDAAISCYAQFCLDNLRIPKVQVRRLPPSTLEINAVKTLSSLVCRFYFLDARTKAIDIHPCDTANDAMLCLSNKIGLRCLDGWAIYEVTPEYERVIKSHDYLADIISKWEMLQKHSIYSNKHNTLTKHNSLGIGDYRFIFKKRLFRNTREIPHDPVEVNLLYAQAVYSVAKKDEFPVSERIALQLAGLQAQVSLGEYVDGRPQSYEDVENYLCYRIRKASGSSKTELAAKIAEAHKMYGKGKADLIAKVWYLSVVMQYPLFGTTQFPVIYKGYLSYGHNLLLGVNAEGILISNPADKSILNAFRYCDIESLTVFPTENFITLKLTKSLSETHKNICFTFETNQKEEIAFLVASYSPNHSNWMRQTNSINSGANNNTEINKRKQFKMTLEDRMRLHHDVINCRKILINSNIMRKPLEENLGILRNTLRKLNRTKIEKLKQEYGNDINEGFFRNFPHSFWAYTKSPMQNSILVISDPELEATAVNNFNAILKYSGLAFQEIDQGTLDEIEWPRATEKDQVCLAQSILDKCLRKDADILRNEFFLQLIKQTTDHPDPNSKVNIKHWQLLALACSITYPSDRRILAYLHAHLRRCALDEITDEGQFAHFTLRNLQGTIETRGRKLAPSRAEILSTINCRRIYARIHFLDGQFQAVEFDACATISEVIEQIQIKIGLRQNAPGYSLYQLLGGNTEQALQPEEKVGDAVAFWEKWHEDNGKMISKKAQHFFIFKVKQI